VFKRKHYGLPGILAVDFVQLRKRSVPFGKAELFPRLFLSHVGPQRFFLQIGSRFWLIMLVRNPSR